MKIVQANDESNESNKNSVRGLREEQRDKKIEDNQTAKFSVR